MKTILIVLDSLGAGALPDADQYGDEKANTLRSISQSPAFHIPNLLDLGLANIEGLEFLEPVLAPKAAYCRLMERSKGKDTTVGHWEIAGIVSDQPLPTFPNGFPEDLIDEFSRKTGRGVLCNMPYSGTEVIRDYGEESMQTGDLIVYTSADSVFQVAAHEDVVPPAELYRICRIAREMLEGKWGVGRVIARPFTGEPGNFTRTANRRDFSLDPPGRTVLDVLHKAGVPVYTVGKIFDLFNGRGIDRSIVTHGNAEGMKAALMLAQEEFDGFVFVNLVDFDMLYGHRQDVDGYAKALSEFDKFLPNLLHSLRPGDRLLITADHGCDPGDESTDHTREYIPLLIYGSDVQPENFETRITFCDIGKTISAWYKTDFQCEGSIIFE